LANFSKLATIFHRRIWCCGRRSCIPCSHWWLHTGTCGWIHIQKNS